MASIRQLSARTLLRAVPCTDTKTICERTAPQASASGNVSAGWTFWRELNLLLSLVGDRRVDELDSLLPERNLKSRCPPCVRDDSVYRQKGQCQTEDTQAQMHCAQRLNLGELQAGNDSPRRVPAAPLGFVSSG